MLGRILADRSSKTARTSQTRSSSRSTSTKKSARSTQDRQTTANPTGTTRPPTPGIPSTSLLLTNPYLSSGSTNVPAPIQSGPKHSDPQYQEQLPSAGILYPTFRFQQHKPKIHETIERQRAATDALLAQHDVSQNDSEFPKNAPIAQMPVIPATSTTTIPVTRSLNLTSTTPTVKKKIIVTAAVDSDDDFDSDDDSYGTKKRVSRPTEPSTDEHSVVHTAVSTDSQIKTAPITLTEDTPVNDSMTIETKLLPTAISLSAEHGGIRAIPQFARFGHEHGAFTRPKQSDLIAKNGRFYQLRGRQAPLKTGNLLPERTESDTQRNIRAQIVQLLANTPLSECTTTTTTTTKVPTLDEVSRSQSVSIPQTHNLSDISYVAGTPNISDSHDLSICSSDDSNIQPISSNETSITVPPVIDSTVLVDSNAEVNVSTSNSEVILDAVATDPTVISDAVIAAIDPMITPDPVVTMDAVVVLDSTVSTVPVVVMDVATAPHLMPTLEADSPLISNSEPFYKPEESEPTSTANVVAESRPETTRDVQSSNNNVQTMNGCLDDHTRNILAHMSQEIAELKQKLSHVTQATVLPILEVDPSKSDTLRESTCTFNKQMTWKLSDSTDSNISLVQDCGVILDTRSMHKFEIELDWVQPGLLDGDPEFFNKSFVVFMHGLSRFTNTANEETIIVHLERPQIHESRALTLSEPIAKIWDISFSCGTISFEFRQIEATQVRVQLSFTPSFTSMGVIQNSMDRNLIVLSHVKYTNFA